MRVRQDSCRVASNQHAPAKAAERRNPCCGHRFSADQWNVQHAAVSHIVGIAVDILDVGAARHTRRSKGLHGFGVPDELQSALRSGLVL